jgi:hypothetical protein
MKTKVVYNGCYGGFGLSDEALALYMAYSGKTKPIREWRGGREIPRHDPALIRVVEELGEEAGGGHSNLVIEEIKGKAYRIVEEDGWESVETPDMIDWVVAE